jgi:hypothetical protein
MKNGVITDENGGLWWYKNDLLHREYGPAIEYLNGYKAWCKNGAWHREEGPARECLDGKEWWLDDCYYGHEKPDNWDELVLISRAKRLIDL